MTANEAWSGWCLMTPAERRAFGQTLVAAGVPGADVARLVVAPLRHVARLVQ